MSNEIVADIENQLRSGRVDQALRQARTFCAQQGGSKESAVEIAKAAANVYRQLIAPPIHEFAKKAGADIGGEPGAIVEKALNRLIEINNKWEKRLKEVHTERLAREMRDALRERRTDIAAQNVARLLTQVSAEQKSRRASYIGGILGTALHHQKEAREMLLMMTKDLGAYGLNAELVRTIESAREKRHGEMVGASLGNIDRELKTNLIDAITDLKSTLPDSTKMGEPDEAMLRETGDAVRSLLRTPILLENADLFVDATNILVDFVPKEESSTAKLAGVEGRAWNSLGYTAKKTIVSVFQDIGKNRFFTQLYANWARGLRDTQGDLRPIIELMGAMRSGDFAPFFQEVRSDARLSATVVPQMTAALGATAGAESAEALLGKITSLTKKKSFESPDQREAEQILNSLGNIIKSPRTTPAERQRILDHLRSTIPDTIPRLQLAAAKSCFVSKPDEMSSGQRQWALKAMAKGLWLPDLASVHQGVPDRAKSEIGPREEIVEAMLRLAPLEPSGTVRAIEPQASRYGVGMIAAAELFEKAKIAEAVPLLDRMLQLTTLHDESATTSYTQEFVWDPANKAKLPLKKDKVLIALVHAIGTIGGQEAEDVLYRYMEQVQIGRFPAPSAELSSFFSRFLGNDALTKKKEEPQEPSGIDADPEEVQAMLKQLTASYFLTGKDKRRAKKVEALTRLARMAPLEAIDPVFKQIADKDPLVASAAITCLTEFAMPFQKKSVREYVIDMCLEGIASRNQATRDGSMKLLKEIGPNRKDVRDKVINFAKSASDRAVKEAIVNVLRTGAGGNSTDTMASFSNILKTSTGGGDRSAKSASAADNIAKLEARRQYMEARRAWIDGGKKGPPPEKPQGVE